MCLINEEGLEHKNLMGRSWGGAIISTLYTVYVSKEVQFNPYFGT